MTVHVILLSRHNRRAHLLPPLSRRVDAIPHKRPTPNHSLPLLLIARNLLLRHYLRNPMVKLIRLIRGGRLLWLMRRR